jgi:hypothetical protein
LPTTNSSLSPEWYAEDFVKQLRIGSEVEQKCEWSCILWAKDHWATEAQKAKIIMQQTKDHLTASRGTQETLSALSLDSQFMNTIAQVYAKLFGTEQFCNVKKFTICPYMGQRHDLLKRGTLAGVFATILHKATSYAMLDKHPLDSGLIHEEYRDVYGIDLTNFTDLEKSLSDGRFEKLYENVVKKARELAGIAQEPIIP